MKEKKILLLVVFLVAFSLLVGCAKVRTYTVVKDRQDQVLSSGNQGYLMGTPKEPVDTGARRMTRKTYVTEVEFLGPKPMQGSESQAQAIEVVQEPQTEGMAMTASRVSSQEPQMQEPPAVVTYKVKSSDTLQKISMKHYGTTKKWKKIYEANRDKLKSPDKIYAGQVLKIPQE